MFGLLRSSVSIISIGYPLYRTTNQLTALQASHDNTLTALTDTIPLSRRDAEALEESMTYWIVLSFWFYLTQLSPVAFLIKILPLSSFAVLYVQIWLGFPIIPINNSNGKVSGAFLIYHYYFDNNMYNFNNLKNKVTSVVGRIGLYVCQFIKKIPSSQPLLNMSKIDITSLENYFNNMHLSSLQKNPTINKNGDPINNIASTIFGNSPVTKSLDKKYNNGLTQMISSWIYSSLTNTNAKNIPPNTPRSASVSSVDGGVNTNNFDGYTTGGAFILSSLFAPFGYKIEELESIASSSAKSVNLPPPLPPKSSKNSSPAPSFDDFAIVSETDLLDANDLNAQMYKAKRGNRSKDSVNSTGSDGSVSASFVARATSSSHDSRHASSASGLETIADETSGLLDSQSTTSSRQSSVTGGKRAYSRSGSRSSWFSKVRG